MTTETLEKILGGQSEAAPADNKPEPSPKPEPQAKTQPAEDDDPDRQAVDVGGQRMVPVAVAQEARGKAKRYTEQIAEFQRQMQERDRTASAREQALEQRLNQVFGLLQQQQPRQQAPQQQEQAPDFFTNPEAAINAVVGAALEKHVGPIAKHVNTMSEATSRRFAVSEHGAETVESAYKAMDNKLATDPAAVGEYRRIMASSDPWGELVKWHKSVSAIAEIGLDPAAYREKLKAEIIAELGQAPLAPSGQQPAPQPALNLPSNLAGTRNAGPRSGPAWSGPSPLGDIFDRRNAVLTRAS